MRDVANYTLERTSTVSLFNAAYCEACERLIFVRALLEDPRHQTRKQGPAVVRLLREGLRAVEDQLRSVRAVVFEQVDDAGAARALAGIGIALAGLRQVHAHLGYLGTRWPLGTADLFVRKLVAEGMPVLVPTLCPTDHYDEYSTTVGADLRAQLAAVGLETPATTGATPVLTLPTMDLIDPLSWAALLYPLAAVMVDAQSMAAQLHGPSSMDADALRRVSVAAVAARLVGESTYAALAARTLLARLGGTPSSQDLLLMARASRPYAQPLFAASEVTLTGYFEALLNEQIAVGDAWGHMDRDQDDISDEAVWSDIDEFLRISLPSPPLPDPEEFELLVEQLRDGRPINARPLVLTDDFGARLQAGVDAERFYAVLGEAEEQPCSLATILGAGWRYKILHTYALCEAAMGGSDPWQAALDTLAGHVLERCALLQQSIEAAYVQQVFGRWQDR